MDTPFALLLIKGTILILDVILEAQRSYFF